MTQLLYFNAIVFSSFLVLLMFNILTLMLLTVEVDITLRIWGPLSLSEQSETHVSHLARPPTVHQHIRRFEPTMILYRRVMNEGHTLKNNWWFTNWLFHPTYFKFNILTTRMKIWLQ